MQAQGGRDEEFIASINDQTLLSGATELCTPTA